MKLHQIKISELKTYEELYEARDSIENDPTNIVGGMGAYCSGYQSDLKVAAQKKIDAIERKIKKMDKKKDNIN